VPRAKRRQISQGGRGSAGYVVRGNELLREEPARRPARAGRRWGAACRAQAAVPSGERAVPFGDWFMVIIEASGARRLPGSGCGCAALLPAAHTSMRSPGRPKKLRTPDDHLPRLHPARSGQGSTVRPLMLRGLSRLRGSSTSGAPTRSSIGTRYSCARGSSRSRLGSRCPCSRRDRGALRDARLLGRLGQCQPTLLTHPPQPGPTRSRVAADVRRPLEVCRGPRRLGRPRGGHRCRHRIIAAWVPGISNKGRRRVRPQRGCWA
jgi:hypothetical protein